MSWVHIYRGKNEKENGDLPFAKGYQMQEEPLKIMGVRACMCMCTCKRLSNPKAELQASSSGPCASGNPCYSWTEPKLHSQTPLRGLALYPMTLVLYMVEPKLFILKMFIALSE